MSLQTVKKLSAKKQKLSLGEVKKAEKANAATARKFIRTTVVNPDDFGWPSISEEDEKELVKLLTSDLLGLKLPNYHVPLSVISKIEQGDRRKYRHIWHTQQALEVGFDVANCTKLRGDLSIGVNCVSTAMEQDKLFAVIIDKDVDPPILTKLLVPIATSKAVPIVAINGLSKICQNIFKIRCIAMGFKGSCRELSHPFNRIYHAISGIAEKEKKSVDVCSLISASSSNLVTNLQQTSASLISVSEGEDKVGTPLKRSCTASSELFKPPKIRKV